MPLNQYLFNSLSERYGAVAIANEGESMTFGSEIRAGGRQISVSWPGEYYRINCPYCHDIRQRLWINHRFGTPHPYNGRPLLFVAICYNEGCLRRENNAFRLYDRLYGLQNRNARPVVRIAPGRHRDPRSGPVALPDPCIPVQDLPPDHHALTYLVGERRYPLATLAHFNVMYCPQANPAGNPDHFNRVGLASDRVIIPVYYRGNLVSWQARYIGTPRRDVPKYFTCPGSHISTTLYNYDRAADKPFVVICEGPMSAWRIGDYAVALFKNKISYYQDVLLSTWDNKPIIFMLEAEGREQMEGSIHHIRRTRRAPVLVYEFPPGGDPGTYDEETIWRAIRQTAEASSVDLGV